MAKADLKNLEARWKQQVGRAVARAFALAGMNHKDAAVLVDRDQAQIARWIKGSERPQLDTLFAVETLRQPLVQALGEMAGVKVEITLRLSA
jgi:hypothetical protein